MWRDELSWRKFASGLISARANLSVCGFAIAQLRDHFVLPIQDAHLAVEIRADHPLALNMKVTGHSQMGFILYGANMSTAERERLNAPIPAVGHQQHGFLASRIDPQAVRRIELSVPVARSANFAQKLAAL